MKDEDYEMIRQLLSCFFNHEFYSNGIHRAKQAISSHAKTQANWNRIKSVVQNRELEPGQPLYLVNHGANQVIDENSDEEAYVWLDKMIYNIERTDGQIDKY